MDARRYVIEIDRIDRDAPGGPTMVFQGFIGHDGFPSARTAAEARTFGQWEAVEVVEGLREQCPGLVVRARPAPRRVSEFERAMAGGR